MKSILDLLHGNVSRNWPGMTTEGIQANLKTLQYLMELSSKVAFDINHWEITAMFRAPDGPENIALPLSEKRHILLTDKTKINQIFFTQYDLEKDDYSKQVASVIESFEKTQKEFCHGLDQTHLAQLKRNAESYRNEISRYIKNVESYCRYLRDSLLQEMAIKKGEYSALKQVTRILIECPFFKFKTVYNKQIQFETRAHVVLTEKNEAAGLDLSVDLGRFVASLDIGDSRIRILPGENNTIYNGYYHPHVGSDGTICFGDQLPAYTEALIKGDYVEAFHFVMRAITHFNPGNPFVSLAILKAIQDKNHDEEQNPQPLQTITAAQAHQMYQFRAIDYNTARDHLADLITQFPQAQAAAPAPQEFLLVETPEEEPPIPRNRAQRRAQARQPLQPLQPQRRGLAGWLPTDELLEEEVARELHQLQTRPDETGQ